MDSRKDHLKRRCPRLGNDVSFAYCRTSGEQATCCFKIQDCWWESFDVCAYLQRQLTEEAYTALVQTRPKPKVTSLIELIEKAKTAVREK